MNWFKRCLMVVPALAVSTALVAAPGESIEGRWQTPDMSGIVEIAPCGTAYCGRIVGGAFNPEMRDTRNKNPSLRSRPIQGLLIMTGFAGGPAEWTGGTIYRPLDGGTYSGTITLVRSNTLALKGCIIWPLCRTQTWNRVR